MLIRSQNKMHLLDASEFEIEKTAIWGYSHFKTSGYVLLGEYATKERVLEVLDNIEESIENYENEKVYSIISKIPNKLYPIYQMPEN